MNHTALCAVATLLLSISGAAAAADTTFLTDDMGRDSTAATSESFTSLTYSLPNASYAEEGGHAATADYADNAANATAADNATNAASSITATSADSAARAALADNALALGGNDYAYYTNASNISTGTLDINRLIGSVVNSALNLRANLLDTGTYAINISGNAATASTAGYASTAGSAQSCTGGAAACDF